MHMKFVLQIRESSHFISATATWQFRIQIPIFGGDSTSRSCSPVQPPPAGEYYGFAVGGYEVLGRKREREMEGLVVRSPFVSTGKKLPFSPLLDSLPSCSASGSVIAITVLKSLKCRRVTRLNWTHG
ncbi:hypothetical protein SDJN03_22443, partial [Cucurbita argyrosperma subsp. sororia]